MEKVKITAKHEYNIIEVSRENNIIVNISGPSENIYRVEFYEKENMSGENNIKHIYGDTIFNGWVCSESLPQDNYPNKIYINIASENGWFASIEYDKLKNTFALIDTEEKVIKIMTPPIILTGAPGGGTSFITKILRNRGLYMGTDSGKLGSRKPHESFTFNALNEIFFINDRQRLEMYTDEDGFKKIQKLINDNTDKYTDLYLDQLLCRLNRFWGGAPLDSIWGWKNNFNGLLIPILQNILPGFKLLVITRDKKPLSNSTHDLQGNWFREKASDSLLNLYMNPDTSLLKKENVFHCNFNEVVSNTEKINDILNWIGLTPFQTDEEYRIFLRNVGYEGEINF